MHGETTSVERSGISGRELIYGVMGVLLGLLVLSAVWQFSADPAAEFPNVTEVTAYDAPAFALRDLSGNTVQLSDYEGKVVLLNFWRTDCEPCKRETPALEAAHQQLGDDGLVILGVDLFNDERTRGRDLADVQNFAALYNVSYPIVLDDAGTVARSYAIAPIPTSYLIDQQGKVRYVKVGELNQSEVEQLFRRLHTEAGS